MMTDPISDMLTRIRNGYQARKQRVDVPASRLKEGIAKLLKQEGYVDDVRRIEDKKQGILEIKLRYDKNQEPLIRELKRVSRPGSRRYLRAQDILRFRHGLGVLILTTPKGLMTDREARRAGVGGEAICSVW